MRKLTCDRLLVGTIAGLLAVGTMTAVCARAEDAGVVRISDADAAVAEPAADAKPAEPKRIEPQPDGEGAVTEGAVYGPYEVGPDYSPFGGVAYSRYSSPMAVWMARSGPGASAGTLPPSYGWTPPIRRPLQNKVAIGYQRYWPQKWYGTPGAWSGSKQRYPVTYVPTDTMQQGYYYQHVPSWQPQPDMIPPAPWPGHWHRRAYPVQYQRYSQYPQGMYYGGTIEQGAPVEASPAPTPAEEKPPAPKSGVEEPAPEA